LVTLLPAIGLLRELNVSFINSLSSGSAPIIVVLVLFIRFLSLGGLPPFIGFLPKWFVLQLLMSEGLMLVASVMILTSLLTLFYYLRLAFSAYLLAKSYWKTGIRGHTSLLVSRQILFLVSLIGLPLAGVLF
jgi:NADH-ubiquinone oxidoreductase chain 2